MNIKTRFPAVSSVWATLGLLLVAATAPAGTLYVWQGSPSPTPPYADWSTAATNIQDAVDAAVAGDEIVVTNGVYQTGAREVNGMSNRVAVTKPVTVRSVNGPAVTWIKGYRVPITTNGPTAVRCVYLTNGAVLAGFTLTNGTTQASGGGVWCEGLNAVVSNCVLTGNSAYGDGGGAYGGILNNCTLTGNSAYYGGGAYSGMLNSLNDCVLTGNSATYGGGACGGTLNNCRLTGNSARLYGGGAYLGKLINSILTGNFAGIKGGGAYNGTLNMCLLMGNSAQDGGGASYGTLNNCTLTTNSASLGGGAFGDSITSCTLNNCIVYYNSTRYIDANYNGFCLLDYCCTIPLPTGIGNLTNAPSFMNTNGWSNLRLQSNSPCINAGTNAYAPGDTDLDGRPRIVGGTVDMGAYEHQGPGMSEFIGWLQQYGLSTDGSADTTDPDGDTRNNWQEWRCGTNPTNASSVLRLLAPVSSANNVSLSWPSVSGVTYFLERSADLFASPLFQPLATNLPGQPGTTTYLDTNAPGLPPRFYRVGVQY